MKNITLNVSGFLEELGLYDLFNVLIYGTTFLCGICLLNKGVNNYLWKDLSVYKIITIVLLIYIIGMVLQEIGSTVDKKITKIYTETNRRILKGHINNNSSKENKDNIIKNPILLIKYRENARKLLIDNELFKDNDLLKSPNISDEFFDDEFINGYYFSICQYTVSVKDKDRKIEKMRALFSMSKSLMSTFFLLSIISVFTLLLDVDMSVEICRYIGIDAHGSEFIIDKIFMIILFFCIGKVFYHRTIRTMENFLLILLGTYDSIINSQ